MASPWNEASHESLFARLVRKIPGFAGYVDPVARAKSDEQARNWLVSHLDVGKQAIDHLAKRLVDQGLYDQVLSCDRLRGRLDQLIARLRGNPSGLIGGISQGPLDADQLEDLYDHDLGAMEEADRLAREMRELADSNTDPGEILEPLQARVAALETKWREREDMLRQAGG